VPGDDENNICADKLAGPWNSNSSGKTA